MRAARPWSVMGGGKEAIIARGTGGMVLLWLGERGAVLGGWIEKVMKPSARPECDASAFSDDDGFAGSGIAADTRFGDLHRENAKVPYLNTITGQHISNHDLKKIIDDACRFIVRQIECAGQLVDKF